MCVQYSRYGIHCCIISIFINPNFSKFGISLSLLLFQTLAKLMVLINYLLPYLSFAFVITSEHSVGLDVCLGKGYFNFFSNQEELCSYNSIFSKGACWTLMLLYAIGSSNILDAYIIFCCVKEIKRSTEKAKKSIGLQNYINRKRSKIAEA